MSIVEPHASHNNKNNNDKTWVTLLGENTIRYDFTGLPNSGASPSMRRRWVMACIRRLIWCGIYP